MGLAMSKQQEVYTLEEAAEYLRIGLSKIRDLVKTGQIPILNYTDKTLFDYEDLRSFIVKSKITKK